MAYATKQQMIDRFGETELAQLTDKKGGQSIDDFVLGRALDDAKHEIDSYLTGRYDLPLAETPGVLVRRACDIARYFLYEDRASETVRQRYDDAVSWLRKVSEGKADLGLDSGNAEVRPPPGAVDSAADRAFGRDNLKNF